MTTPLKPFVKQTEIIYSIPSEHAGVATSIKLNGRKYVIIPNSGLAGDLKGINEYAHTFGDRKIPESIVRAGCLYELLKKKIPEGRLIRRVTDIAEAQDVLDALVAEMGNEDEPF